MNDLIKETENLRKRIIDKVKDKATISMKPEYSNLITFLLLELRCYSDKLSSYAKLSMPAIYHYMNAEFLSKLLAYAENKEFTPLTKAPEFKDLFATLRYVKNAPTNEEDKNYAIEKMLDTPNGAIALLSDNLDSILEFSVKSQRVLSTNRIFEDETLYSFLPVKVVLGLNGIDSPLSAEELVKEYENGGVDKLFPKALEDQARYQAAQEKAKVEATQDQATANSIPNRVLHKISEFVHGLR